MADSYQLLINEERTVLVRIWPDGQTEVALRDDPGDTWGPPIRLRDERAEGGKERP